MTPALAIPAELEGKVRFVPTGMVIEPGLDFDAWLALGYQLRGVARAVNLSIADWLAYGDFEYRDASYGKRMPNGIYELAAQIFDREPKTLRNYKWVATKIPQETRPEKFMLQHGLEILSAGVPERQIPMWVAKVAAEGLKTRPLRRELRETYSEAPRQAEPHDRGEDGFFPRASQFVIDFQHASAVWTSAQWEAYRELLEPVIEAFERRAA